MLNTRLAGGFSSQADVPQGAASAVQKSAADIIISMPPVKCPGDSRLLISAVDATISCRCSILSCNNQGDRSRMAQKATVQQRLEGLLRQSNHHNYCVQRRARSSQRRVPPAEPGCISRACCMAILAHASHTLLESKIGNQDHQYNDWSTIVTLRGTDSIVPKPIHSVQYL